nr:MAG TPA: hypothetical protein [Caudoviricetes sp.]DAU48798.1 MAG TPA: hypothetical protein [Caudoviricetes sp.]
MNFYTLLIMNVLQNKAHNQPRLLIRGSLVQVQ